jgi:inorganic triphosphatase YgiF
MRATAMPSGAAITTRAGNSVGGNTEVELKLAIAPGDTARLLRHPAIAAIKHGHARKRTLVAVYFDTRDRALCGAGVALRLRREGAAWIQALKGPALPATGAGLCARDELEWRISRNARRPRLDPAALAGSRFESLFRTRASADFLPVFETHIERTDVDLVFADGTRARLSLDRGDIRVAGRRAREPVSEVEIELIEGESLRLFDLARTLIADLDIAVAPFAKAERGYRLADRVAPTPCRARPVDVTAIDDVDTMLARVLIACTQQIERNAAGLATGGPEFVHQMRVGIRRLRAALPMLRDRVPAATLELLDEGARHIADTLAPARDLFVIRHEILPRMARAGKAGDAVREIDPALERLEEAANAACRQLAASRRLHAWVLEIGALCATPRFGSSADVPAAMQHGPRPFAARILARRHRRLQAAGRHLEGRSAEERHRARIAAKKLRYAIEFFAPLFPRRATERFIGALAQLQDALGDDNDVETALRTVRAIAGDGSSADRALTAAAKGDRKRRERSIVKAWSRFAGCSLPWRGGD